MFAQAHAPQQPMFPTASAAMAASIASNNPCSTLFVANLGPAVNEHELKEVFASFPGFCRLRMHNKNGSPVAFVEYSVRSFKKQSFSHHKICLWQKLSQDVRQAVQAMSHLQGFILLSSDRGGIRIEYAKHKMGEVYCRLLGISSFFVSIHYFESVVEKRRKFQQPIFADLRSILLTNNNTLYLTIDISGT